tara:strand:+ start:302 stop:505 length:204 start_codon:yes stop_codon:yes gene_type:complete
MVLDYKDFHLNQYHLLFLDLEKLKVYFQYHLRKVLKHHLLHHRHHRFHQQHLLFLIFLLRLLRQNLL